jgi:hypothetical protein
MLPNVEGSKKRRQKRSKKGAGEAAGQQLFFIRTHRGCVSVSQGKGLGCAFSTAQAGVRACTWQRA